MDGMCHGCGRIVPAVWTNCALSTWTECAWTVDKMCRIGVDKMCPGCGHFVPAISGSTRSGSVDKMCPPGGKIREIRMWTNCACTRKSLLRTTDFWPYYTAKKAPMPVEYRSASMRRMYREGCRVPFSKARIAAVESIREAAADSVGRPFRRLARRRYSGQKAPCSTRFSAGNPSGY